MSASNWEICPKCVAVARKEIDYAHDYVENLTAEQLAEVPSALVNAMRRQIKTFSEEDYRTLREDYEFWIRDGHLNISYSGSCDVCKLTIEFNDRKPIDGLDEDEHPGSHNHLG